MGSAPQRDRKSTVTRRVRLVIVLVVNLGLVTGLVIVGLTAHSLGVLAEGGDYLADAAAIGVSLLAIWLSERPPTASRPAGHPMATTYAAGVNAGWLMVLSVLVLTGAITRLTAGSAPVDGLSVVIVSGIAALVMLGGALILRGDTDDQEDADGDDEDLNMRAILLDTAGDSAAALGVAVAGAIILATHGLFWVDPAIAALIAVVVGYHAVRLLLRIATTLRTRQDSH